MADRGATAALLHTSRVVCAEAREAVDRSASMRDNARATVGESRRLCAAAVVLCDDAWMLRGLQRRAP
jgi:hypothetical protein